MMPKLNMFKLILHIVHVGCVMHYTYTPSHDPANVRGVTWINLSMNACEHMTAPCMTLVVANKELQSVYLLVLYVHAFCSFIFIGGADRQRYMRRQPEQTRTQRYHAREHPNLFWHGCITGSFYMYWFAC